jgi:geranylgeranyl pyrophosphate synthase
MELLQQQSSSTREQFVNNFGKPMSENVEQALAVMRDLNVVERFREFEHIQIEEIEREIDDVQVEEIRPILHNIIRVMRGRKA